MHSHEGKFLDYCHLYTMEILLRNDMVKNIHEFDGLTKTLTTLRAEPCLNNHV